MGKAGKGVRNPAKSVLPICLSIQDDIERDLARHRSISGNALFKFFRDLVEDDVKGALSNLKDVTVHGGENGPCVVLRTLARCFLITEARSSVNGALASNIDGILDNDFRKKALDCLVEAMGELLLSVTSDFAIEAGRHVTDIFLTCLNDFALGLEVLRVLFKKALHFLRWYLEVLLSKTGPDNERNHDVASTLKCFVLVVKKCVTTKVDDRESICNDDAKTLHQIVASCESVLAGGSFGWDCCNAAGMAWAVVLRTLYDDFALLDKIKDTLGSFTAKLRSNGVDENVDAGLYFCNGVMVTIDRELLVLDVGDDYSSECLLIHYILPFFKLAAHGCLTISQEIILAKCFTQWSNGTRSMCKASKFIRRSLLKKNKGKASIVEDLMSYTIDKLEHPTDAIRHQANEMLANLLSIANELGAKGISEDLVGNVLCQSWEKKSTFTALNCLLLSVSPELVLRHKPDITYILLNAMQHQTLAPYASETYKLLACKSREVASSSEDDLLVQYKDFLDPLLCALCGTTVHCLRLLIDYCYLKLLRVYGNDCIGYIFSVFKEKLSTYKSVKYCHDNTKILAAYLACVKASLMSGYLSDNDASVCDQSLLLSTLLHHDNEIRILGFAVVCESVKPSNLISTKTLDALRYALPFNITCQDPAFRQRLINSVKKFLKQLKANMARLEKLDKQETSLATYNGFIVWLAEFSVRQLYPTAPYPKRVTCVHILNLVVQIFGSNEHHDVFSPEAVKSLFALLSDPYEDVKQAAFALLSSPKLTDCVKSAFTAEWFENMVSVAMERARRCSKPERSVEASYHLKLYAKYHGNKTQPEKSSSEQLRLFSTLLNFLDESISDAEKNIYVAATESPMYGVLHCLKSILQSVDFRVISSGEVSVWRGSVSQVVDSCLKASAVVLPVVGSVSPEGHLPDLELAAAGEVNGGVDDAWNKLPETLKSLIVDENVGENEMKTRTLAQKVLVCCWRTAKESSLLLQEVSSSHLPLDSSRVNRDGVLSWEKLLKVGEHLKKQLTEARHRGAFEIAYYAFKTYCSRLWSIQHEELSSVPGKWMHAVLSDMKDLNKCKELCATRRSAGLPFLMQALLSGNKSAKGKKHLQYAMSTLLRLCEASDSAGLISKVHASNVLRGLVKDAALGEEILPYVSQCMQVSLAGFNSSMWAVRNSSTLLFSALFTRIFGVKRDKNDDLCLKNRLSGNEFSSRLPGLFPYLVALLTSVCRDLDKGGHRALCPTLHPILLLLARIYPSTKQLTSGVDLNVFAPLLLSCRASAAYKSRVAAAVALAGILTWDRRLPTLEKCCENLVKDVAIAQGKLLEDAGIGSSPQNRIHGGLLQIKEILQRQAKQDQCRSLDSVRAAVACASSALGHVITCLGSRQNTCPLTRSTSLEVFLLIHRMRTKFTLPADDGWTELGARVKESSQEELTASTSVLQRPGQTFLLHRCAELAIYLAGSPKETLGLFDSVLATGSDDLIQPFLESLSINFENVATEYGPEDLRHFEALVAGWLSRNDHNVEISTTMYQMLSKVATEVSTKSLFQQSMSLAASCNAGQSALLTALINFQSSCVRHVLSEGVRNDFRAAINEWLNVLSLSSRAYENTDDVRVAAANSLHANVEVLTDPTGIFGACGVKAWMIVINLLCDEETSVRKVACNVVHEALVDVAGDAPNAGHPSVDFLALRHAAALLLVTHGKSDVDECRHALRNLAECEPQIVPVSVKVDNDDGKAGDRSENLPGLFARSETNTYLDAVYVSEVARIGVDALEELPEDGSDPKLLLEKFETPQRTPSHRHCNDVPRSTPETM